MCGLDLLVVLAVVAVIWYVVQGRPAGVAGPSAPGRDRALDVARERYARGEISKDELDEIARTLRS